MNGCRGRATALLAVMIALAACTPASPAPAGSHAAHDPQVERVKDILEASFGMTFESAGPHHVLGTAPDGVELDLVGVPVEQLVLSVPDERPTAGVAYLPHLRDLLHGPPAIYDWVAEVLACHAAGRERCGEREMQGQLEARVNADGGGYVVVTLSRG